MASIAAKLFDHGIGYPIADGSILRLSLATDLIDQTLGQLDSKDRLGLGDRKWNRLLLGSMDVTGGLARGNAKLSSQTRDSLRRGDLSVQKLKGLVHAPVILGLGRPSQYDL